MQLRLLLAVAMLAAGCTSAAKPAAVHHSTPPTADRTASYLALGDSVVFGFRLNAPNYKATASFIGYPTYVGKQLHLLTTNASCPGEATGGFMKTASPIDNGCKFFKSQFGLHVHYQGSQLDYALAFLKSHPQTLLVTLGLGANDGFLLQRQCGSNASCLKSGSAKLGAQIVGNLKTILHALRATGYRGNLLITNYYSLDYTDAALTTATNQLNQVVTTAAAAEHVDVVDVFGAFKSEAVRLSAGKTCTAGLLNRMSAGPDGCDVHPSTAGQQLIAKTVVAAYLKP
jgi:lysophospholipase L1-like esterase